MAEKLITLSVESGLRLALSLERINRLAAQKQALITEEQRILSMHNDTLKQLGIEGIQFNAVRIPDLGTSKTVRTLVDAAGHEIYRKIDDEPAPT
jgi:hypothetical protein